MLNKLKEKVRNVSKTVTDLDERDIQNITGRIENGVGIKDSFNLDLHIARVIVNGLQMFPSSERAYYADLEKATRIVLDADGAGYKISEKNNEAINKGLKQLKKDFFGLWW